MAIVVEDGTGRADSVAYASLAEVTAYLLAQGVDDESGWLGTDAVLEAAIVKATRYIDATYSFKGEIRIQTQALAWPRAYVTDRHGRMLAADAVPAAVKAATAEVALLSLTTDLTPVVAATDRVARVKAGSAEVEFESGAKDQGTRITIVDRLIGDLTSGGTGYARKTVRAY